MVRAWWWRAGAALALFVPFACGDEAVATQDVVEIDTLTYTVAEADAFRAALQGFRASHADREIVAVHGQADLLAFEQVMTSGRPPDAFQSRSGYDMVRWVTRGTSSDAGSLLLPLDAVAADLGYAARIPAGVLGALTVGGHLYGVPFTIERDNTLYYNKKIFDQNGLEPPRTLAEFFTVAEAFKAKGIIPLAVGSAWPWSIGLIAWPWLLVEQAGAAYYADFFGGNKDPADPEIQGTLDKLAHVLGFSNYRVKSAGVAASLAANAHAADPEDPTTLYWRGAVDLVIDGKAAMTIAGDFAKTYLTGRGQLPDVDFGEIAAPGTGGTFVFFGTAFGLPKASPHPAIAADLVKVLGAAQAQARFNAASGTIPPCNDADRTAFDAMDRKRMDDLAGATAVVPVYDTLSSRQAAYDLDKLLAAFAQDGDVGRAVSALTQRYAAIKSP
jgi:glucose/mannose transport system substrate-binding protein